MNIRVFQFNLHVLFNYELTWNRGLNPRDDLTFTKSLQSGKKERTLELWLKDHDFECLSEGIQKCIGVSAHYDIISYIARVYGDDGFNEYQAESDIDRIQNYTFGGSDGSGISSMSIPIVKHIYMSWFA